MDFSLGYKLFSYCSKVLPFIYALVGFTALIVMHEFGHFLFCKLFNIHTPTFSIGMGPKIIERKIGDTNFRISALPLGGYVEIAGMQEVGQGDQEHAQAKDDTSFSTKPYWQKLIVILGGVSFNMIFAYLALISLFIIGVPRYKVGIKTVMDNLPAERSGLKPGDQIRKIGKWDIDEKPENFQKAIDAIASLKDEKITFLVKRGSYERKITIKVPAKAIPGKGKLGIAFDLIATDKVDRFPIGEAIQKGIARTHDFTYRTIMGIKNLFTTRSIKNASGPLGILSHSAQQAKQGFAAFLFFLAIISISLAVFNLLPIPALDGGQLWFITIETIMGREIPIGIKNAIFIGSWVLLLSLILYVTYNDIKMLLGWN